MTSVPSAAVLLVSQALQQKPVSKFVMALALALALTCRWLCTGGVCDQRQAPGRAQQGINAPLLQAGLLRALTAGQRVFNFVQYPGELARRRQTQQQQPRTLAGLLQDNFGSTRAPVTPRTGRGNLGPVLSAL